MLTLQQAALAKLSISVTQLLLRTTLCYTTRRDAKSSREEAGAVHQEAGRDSSNVPTFCFHSSIFYCIPCATAK